MPNVSTTIDKLGALIIGSFYRVSDLKSYLLAWALRVRPVQGPTGMPSHVHKKYLHILHTICYLIIIFIHELALYMYSG